MTEVVASLIWDNDKFMICQRPVHRARVGESVADEVKPEEENCVSASVSNYKTRTSCRMRVVYLRV